MKMNLWDRWMHWRNRDREIESEIGSHIEMLKQDLVERGETPAQAEIHACREFGNRTLIAEVTRETWGCAPLERFSRDVRFGIRSLLKRPGFAVASMLIVALGVGANTAVFSIVNELLIRPLPYPDADRIVDIAAMDRHTMEIMPVSAADFKDYRDQNSVFAAMAIYSSYSGPSKAGPVAEYAEMTTVSPEFFDVFQQRPLRGRLFSESDFITGHNFRAALISEGYWRSHFASDPKVLGRKLRLSSSLFTVIGVLPREFCFPAKAEIWIPLDPGYYRMSHGAHNFLSVGRLKQGIGIQAAQAQMSRIAERLERQFPTDNKRIGAKLTLLRDRKVAHLRQSLLLLFGAVGAILLIAWVNLAGILLVRTTARTREMATRLALGASHGHLRLQLIAESAVLAVPVAVLSLLLAYAGRRVLLTMASKDIAELGNLSFGLPVLVFAVGLSIFTTFLFSCLPAWYACNIDVNGSLKEESNGRVAGGGRTRYLRGVLVVGEIALSVVLMAAAGLLIKSFNRLQNVDLGFEHQNVLVMTASYPASRRSDPRDASRFFGRLRSEVESIPGVKAAGAIRSLPGEKGWSSGDYVIDHWPKPGTTRPEVLKTARVEITPGTFRALGVPLIRGREFADSDAYGAPLVAIVSQALVRHSFPHQDPIGRTILCGQDQWSIQGMRIVGVVGDIHQFGPADPALPVIYMPNAQHLDFTTKMHILVRSSLDPAVLTQTVRRKALELSPDVPVKFTMLETLRNENMATARFSALLLGILATLALSLAVVGVYGVMAYLVVQRSGEIGVRMALGARIGQVFGMVLREGVRLTTIGLVLGLVGAYVATRLIGSLLFEVKTNDPLVYAGVSVLLVLVAVAAISVPAWRAAHVSPMAALRLE